MKKILPLFLMATLLFSLSSQSIGSGNSKSAKLNEVLPYSNWEMRIIEVGPTRDFYGSITNISFDAQSRASYRRQIQVIRGNIRHKKDASTGDLTLFNLRYKYTIKNDTLYYVHEKEEIPLLKRVARAIPASESNQNDTPSTSTESAILDWLKQNSQDPSQTPAEDHRRRYREDIFTSELIGSYWQLVDYKNPLIMTSLAKELNWKPEKGVFFSIIDNGDILIESSVEATGKLTIGDPHVATIILSYTDTGWNSVIGKDRLFRLELKTSAGTRIIYHIVSDDGRSIYPTTIRRVGTDNPSEAFVNRTHVFSQLESSRPAEEI
ncbi:hypothetical protein [Entomospira culicis]|uniref:Uncharacterized protein n=1 Tax=Entomospira culicis TaxID=2719989 RepID=A0A968GIR1_9SPIO|nr:hypothetical protein [Entomospira culicis]NIZ19391.1 hypothetical protein [Entomospira culicis]NIZ69704.1 hypothetical protein [Entomospira culicis]WDI36814.1 hypothetical protein PVA46_05670 [Entomospira culicis]WDI38443.1 hypothetical protein PVA47_05680 [Entomospira culicis]